MTFTKEAFERVFNAKKGEIALTLTQAGVQNKGYEDLTALQKHVLAFGAIDDQGKLVYSTDTISRTLAEHREPHPTLIGAAVKTFNALHSGHYNPFGSVTFSCPHQKEFGDSLHLGTFRLYGKDGVFNDTHWQEMAGDKEYLRLPELLRALEAENKQLPDEASTGRNVNNWFSNRCAQETAGNGAWGQVFKTLVCHWDLDETSKHLTPCIHADLAKAFFTDTPACLAAARELGLPVAAPKPFITDAADPTAPDNPEAEAVSAALANY